jgi:cyclohexanone monooxygenase
LRGDIQLNTRVESAHFDESTNRWAVSTDDGGEFEAKYLIMATGCLSSTNLPNFDGLDSFTGEWYHTGQWPHEPIDFTGKRVAVIGTGSSGIQSIPLIAEQAEQLTVFQRSPNFSIPAHNKPLDPNYVRERKAGYAEFRAANRETSFHANFDYNEANAVDVSAEERVREYEARWAHGGLPFLAAFADLIYDAEANATAAEFISGKISELVIDPATAALLTPTSVVGCKRLCVDTNYYATFNRSNVTLVDVRNDPIESITPLGLNTASREYEFDALVFATGFDAMTGALTKIDIRGLAGRTLQDAWTEGPKTYLGLAIAGFPNLFTVTGPGSPSVLTNMLPSIEHHVDWITDCITYVDQKGVARIDATPEAQDAWVVHVNEVGDASLFPNCNSWYLGANIPGKPRVFMPYLGFPPYAEKCREVADNGYVGFMLTAQG